jgi:hypothetical protein
MITLRLELETSGARYRIRAGVLRGAGSDQFHEERHAINDSGSVYESSRPIFAPAVASLRSAQHGVIMTCCESRGRGAGDVVSDGRTRTDNAAASGLDGDERWELVKRIAAKPSFRKSPRLKQFLFFITERSLSGHPEETTEYNIGWKQT